MTDINQTAENIFKQVTQAGASADLIIDQGQSLSLKAQKGELEEYKVSSSQVFGLRVIKDQRVGTAYSEAADTDALSSMVDQALTNASFVKTEIHENILPNNDQLKTDDALLSPEDNTPIEQKIAFALQLETELAGKEKVASVPYNGVQDVLSQRHIFSSAGLNAYSQAKMCSAYTYALVEDGEHNAMQGIGQAARLFSALNAEHIIEQSYASSMGILNGTPVPSKHYDVIFDEECQADVFRVFAMMFSGKSAKDEVNPMRDKLGEFIADPRLSIFDNPLNTDGFGYSLFDAEGTATCKTELVKQGSLRSLLHNSATASHFNLASTGHASRGPKSTLSVSSHQLEIANGSDDLSTLLSGEYLYLTDLTGLHSGANPVSGNFSFGASGYLYQNGEQVQAVRSITVAGNFYQMLQNINCIGKQQYWNWQRTALMPRIRFAELAISG